MTDARGSITSAFDVFLSYAHADAEWVRVLAENLHQSGLHVFFDEWEIGPGDVLVHRLDQGILQSRHGVLVVSPGALERPWVPRSTRLMGTDARDRALVEMWQRRMEFEILIPIAQVFRNAHPFFAGRIPQVPEWGEVCRKAAEHQLAWLDQVLAEREFIAGERYSIADITALVGIDFGRVSRSASSRSSSTSLAGTRQCRAGRVRGHEEELQAPSFKLQAQSIGV